ncbi:dynein-1-alpha heavy chain, flagellar inner arm I1 complex-like [Stegodyphus dumicola]|uniref:dynein-1-alpha heavy chain, flagellar inner arm I1 complex-like n=1 Tax=Stegodyphus dumicola TaxID=202533 RepID=UPI0015AD6B5D|nr:dynein-1-alpha heavy chain, flagellar inner arm I1 complex-like [Stegodyphus dumicola]
MPEYFEFGFINQHPLVALNQVVSNIYLPLFQDEHLITKILPENCKLQSKQVMSLFSEFNQETKEFIDSTNEAIHQIEKPFVFKLPDIPSSCVLEELAQEAQFVAETQELVSEWITVITDLLEECSQKENPGNDLLSEIEFWKSQKFKLSTYFDQLSHSDIQKSINILQLANCDLLEFHSSVSKIEDRLIKVIDIVKYLILLENNIKNFLSGATTDEAQKSLSDLFIVLKIMWIQSSYYKEVPNMCRIIRGVSVLLMNKVKKDAEIQFLFRKPLDEVRKIANDSIQILTCWTDLYEAQCEDLKKYGGCHWWRFDVRLFFDETHYMIEICRDLDKIAETLQQLKNIFNTNLKHFAQDIEGLRVLEIRIFGMTSRIQYAGFDIFDPKCKLDWNLIINAFYRDVKNFEDEVKNYINEMFHSILSWENAYILTESFYKVFLSSSIKQFIDKSHDNMIKQFLREIYETENEFLTYEDEPPCFENVPPTASAILWVEELLSKLTHPMSRISARSALSKKK